MFPVLGEWGVQRDGFRGARALVRAIRDPGFVNLHGLVLDPHAEAEVVRAACENFDLVWFFQLRTANYFRRARWERSVVDIDDLPSAKIGSCGALAPGFGQRVRAAAWHQAARVHERRLANRFTVRAVCSEGDRETLGGDSSIHVIPNGFARPKGEPVRAPSDPLRIGFIGLMDYEPNRDGVRWFLKHCWPTLRESVSGLQFRLAGKGAREVVTSPPPGVEVLGWIDDAAAEIATWAAMVIPIRSGAGTRIKIADTFSRKCPAVSTRLGAYGYDVEDGRQLRLADTPEDFTRACLDVLGDPEGAAAMADRAWREFLEKWTWEAIAPRVRAAAEAALEG
jgi:glycosyltransferase involved in cell wall biosynthesis